VIWVTTKSVVLVREDTETEPDEIGNRRMEEKSGMHAANDDVNKKGRR
jgi:hypothetical protein